MTDVNNHKLEVFICGEILDLSIATCDFAKNSNWHNWFNSRELTKFLYHGIYPNNQEDQLEYFKNIPNDRLLLVITDKQGRNIGVISLSSINQSQKSCDIALVVSDDGDKRMRPYISLEAMSLMTTHAFQMLDMERVNASQHIALAGWQNRLELLGYRLEGLHKNKFKKGCEVSDIMSIAASKTDFETLIEKRNGCLWDSYIEMKKRVRNLPRRSCLSLIQELYDNEIEFYYENVFDL